MKLFPSFFKNPVVQFILMPTIVVYLTSFFLDFSPDGLCQQLVDLQAIEKSIEGLEKTISEFENQPLTNEIRSELAKANDQLHIERVRLSRYKNTWDHHVFAAARQLSGRPGRTAGIVFQPYLLLINLAILFLAMAFTRYVNIPFFIRAGAISTGSVFAIIALIQFFCVTHCASLWYSKVAGVIFAVGLLLFLIYSWVNFIIYHLLPRRHEQ